MAHLENGVIIIIYYYNVTSLYSSGGLRPPQQSMIQTLLLSNYSELYWERGRPKLSTNKNYPYE